VRGKPDTAGDPRWHGLDPGPRRALAARILAVLEYHGVSYAVLRDPSRLFDEGLGDLDVWMPGKSIRSATGLMEREAEAAGWWLLKRVQRPYVSTLYLYRPGQPASTLTVDVFPAIRWLMADLVSETLLAESRVRKANAWIVDPRVSALASCLHHLAWNGSVADRYLEAYLRLDAGDDLPYSRLVQGIAKDPNPHWKRCRRRLLTSAIATSVVMHPVRACDEALRILAALARSSPGRWVAFAGPESDQYLTEIDRRLHEEHFLVGRWGSVGRVPRGVIARTGWYARNVMLKRRLGAIVLSAGDRDLRSDARVWASHSGWEAQGHDETVDGARGQNIEDCFQYILTSLASKSRIETPGSHRRNGIIVGVVGPEESSKANLTQQLESESSLQPAVRYQRSPRVFPQIKRFVNADPAKSDKRSELVTHGVLMSLGRLAYGWLDTQLGFAIVLHRLRSAGFVVLIELTFPDVTLDSTRYGLGLPGWLLELASRASLQPGLLLYLTPMPVPQEMEGDASLSTDKTRRLTGPFRLIDTRNLDSSAGPDDLARRAREVINGARGTA
jgi:hypothetical protein